MESNSEVSKDQISKGELIRIYMEHVLEHGFPKSVYDFAKKNNFSEADFYNFYGSLDSIKKAIWIAFYEHVETLIYKNEAFNSYNNREKLLTFYFTFFEMLTANRSYVLLTLDANGNKLENLKQLASLRNKIIEFGKTIIGAINEEQPIKFLKKPEAIVTEAIWVQFLFLLKFWIKDESQGFEKTDVAIEKSVHTVFDIFDNTPLNSIIDFGKFLWKESTT